VEVVEAIPIPAAKPALLIAIGFRPEHLRTPDVFGKS
jgi:hypothetical protein